MALPGERDIPGEGKYLNDRTDGTNRPPRILPSGCIASIIELTIPPAITAIGIFAKEKRICKIGLVLAASSIVETAKRRYQRINLLR